MLGKIIKIIRNLFKQDILVNFSEINEVSKKYDTIKSNVRVAKVPEDGETVYFSIDGPFYLVTNVSHDLTVNDKQVIWVNLNKISK